MLVVLPVTAFLLLWAAALHQWPSSDKRLTLLRATSAWAVIALVTTEGLSLLGLLHMPGLAISWLLVSTSLLAYLVWIARPDLRQSVPTLGQLRASPSLPLWGTAAIFGITFVVGFLAAPNTWDSLTTHLSRIAHWLAQGSLAHYATGIELQNFYPPFPAVSILQTYALLPGDRLAFASQWLAMIVAIVGSTYLARRFGADRKGQWLVAVFMASMPIGIAQASSTMTDYVTALWAVALAVETLECFQRPSLMAMAAVAVNAALAINTKPTAYPIVLVAGLAAGYACLRRGGPKRLLQFSAIGVVVVLALNLGYLGRNWQTYGHPLGERSRVNVHGNVPFDVGVIISNVTRNVALHLGTPSPHINKAIFLGVKGIHDLLGLNQADPRTSVHGFKVDTPSRHETKVGNLLHTIALGAAIVGLAISKRQPSSGWLTYTGALALAFMIFSGLFQFSTFGARYQLPYFLLAAPIVGLSGSMLSSRLALVILPAVLLVGSLPWLFSLESRPLIAWPGDAASLLASKREQSYYAYSPGLERTYKGIIGRIEGASCREIGLLLHGNSAEYPLWVLMDFPAESVHFGWIVAGNPSARYFADDYDPCAVICADCPDTVTIRGLPRVESRANYQLYLDE